MGTEKRTVVHDSSTRRLIAILIRIAKFAVALLEKELQE